LEPLLPPPRGHGRPYHDHRRILNGILFVLHTGVPWRDLPERYGPGQTVYSRLRRWTARRRWEQLSQLQARLAEEDRIAWTMRWGAPVRRRDQGPSGDRRPGPPAGAAPDRRSAPGVRGARAGARGGPHPAPAGAAAPAPRGARRGQGVHLSAAPALAPRGTCGRSFPSGAISRTRGAIGPADAPPSIESPIATRYKKLAIQYLAMLYVGLSEKYLTTLFAGTA
jgi:transposase